MRCAPNFPANTGARSTASAPIRPSSSQALTKAGFLAALIPEEYGGSGLTMSAAVAIMEEIHAAGCNGAACHAQMYTMGTVLRHGSAEQKQKYLPGIATGELRLQAFGVTEPTSGTDTLSLRTTAVKDGNSGYVVNGQKIWTSRAEHSDLMLLLARTTPREQAKSRTDGLSVFLVDMRAVKGKGLTIRPIRTMMNHATTEVFFDNMKIPADSLVGEEDKGFRYILSGMNAERILIASECIGDAKWFIEKASAYAKERVLFDRPIGQNQGVQFPIARCYMQMRAAELMVHEAAQALRGGRGLRRAGQHGEAARRRGVLGRGRHVPADPRRLRLRRGVRHRAQVPRDAALHGRADLDQPRAVVHRRACARPAEVVLECSGVAPPPPLPACGERSTRAARRVRGSINMRPANVIKTTGARRLRQNSTDAELRLWYRLRSRSIEGRKFVRQEPIGPHVVDFVCREARLVLEVDGGQHADSEADRIRDRWLTEHNYRVLRFWNHDVLKNMDGVLEVIAAAVCAESPPHPTAHSASKTRVNALEGGRPLPAGGER